MGRLTEQGVLTGMRRGGALLFEGDKPLSRYAFAVALQRFLRVAGEVGPDAPRGPVVEEVFVWEDPPVEDEDFAARLSAVFRAEARDLADRVDIVETILEGNTRTLVSMREALFEGERRSAAAFEDGRSTPRGPGPLRFTIAAGLVSLISLLFACFH